MREYVLIIIAIYSVAVFFVGLYSYKKGSSLEEINLGNKEMGSFHTSLSVAATWIWAPALFVASERAYVEGLLGLGWFLIPNVLALILFAYISKKAINRAKDAHTLADVMYDVYNTKRMKNIYAFELVTLSIFSTAVQLLAGGRLLNIVTDINFGLITVLMASVALVYSLLSGIKASVRTDVIQMVIIFSAVALTLVFLMPNFDLQLGGIDERTTNPISVTNWQYFIAFGLTTTIGLLAGPIGDQTFWQRAYSTNKANIMKSFGVGALIFALVPIGTGLIGFLASGAGFVADDVSMVGLEFVIANTPTFVVLLFVMAIVSGLSSTLDSNMCAIGSLVSRHSKRTAATKYARIGMASVALFGIVIANLPGMEIFVLFLFYGVLRSTVAIPTIATMTMKKTPSEPTVFFATLFAIIIGVPTYAIGSLLNISFLQVIGTLLAILIPLCIIALKTIQGGMNKYEVDKT